MAEIYGLVLGLLIIGIILSIHEYKEYKKNRKNND